MSDLHLRISWALASEPAGATPPAVVGPDVTAGHPVFQAARGHRSPRIRSAPTGPSARFDFPELLDGDDAGPDECA